MPRYLKFLALAVVAVLAFTVQPAQAGTIILEGSDAIGFHSQLGSAAAIAYRDQVWSAIGGPSPLAIAVIGSPVLGTGSLASGTHPIVQVATVGALGPLSSYVALYFLAGGGCCVEDDTLPAGNEPAISAYLAAGGTVMIENYVGGAAWDFAVGTGGAGNAFTAGFGGALPGPGCTDAEAVTALGLSNGFTQPDPMGCWTHQAYDKAFFGALGFTLSFFDADPAFGPGPGGAGMSSLLSSGKTVTGMVPEPSSIALLCIGGLGLIGYGVRRRMRAA